MQHISSLTNCLSHHDIKYAACYTLRPNTLYPALSNSKTHGVPCMMRSKISTGARNVPPTNIFNFSQTCGGLNGAKPRVRHIIITIGQFSLLRNFDIMKIPLSVVLNEMPKMPHKSLYFVALMKTGLIAESVAPFFYIFFISCEALITKNVLTE